MQHYVERTSPKGQPFLGTCRLCGRMGLSISEAMTGDCDCCDDDQQKALIAEQMRADPDFMAGVKAGLKARAEGKFRPWADIKRELGIE